MYDGWAESGVHSHEWMAKTKEFVDYAFSLSATTTCIVVLCPSAHVQIVTTINAMTKY